ARARVRAPKAARTRCTAPVGATRPLRSTTTRARARARRTRQRATGSRRIRPLQVAEQVRGQEVVPDERPGGVQPPAERSLLLARVVHAQRPREDHAL